MFTTVRLANVHTMLDRQAIGVVVEEKDGLVRIQWHNADNDDQTWYHKSRLVAKWEIV